VLVLAVDHGEKRIGVAISDPTGTISRPLLIIKHVSQTADTGRVLELAALHQAGVIVIGESTDEEGAANAAGRRARRFAAALRNQTSLPVVLWDESLSSSDAMEARIASGASRKRRAGHIDALAAAMILQSYLDANTGSGQREAAA
jgi:putative Holliday junction resolvase